MYVDIDSVISSWLLVCAFLFLLVGCGFFCLVRYLPFLEFFPGVHALGLGGLAPVFSVVPSLDCCARAETGTRVH